MADTARLMAELASLDEERLSLDRRLRDANAREQHGGAPEERDRAHGESQDILRAMDDLMTRIRIAEGKLDSARKGRKLPWA